MCSLYTLYYSALMSTFSVRDVMGFMQRTKSICLLDFTRVNLVFAVLLVVGTLFVGCEKLDVPPLDDEEEEKTETPTVTPEDGGDDTGNDDVNDGAEDGGDDINDENNDGKGDDSGDNAGDEGAEGDDNDKYQGFGSLMDQINNGGTKECPFRSWDLAHGELGEWILANEVGLTDCWVEGYIVGYISGNSIKSAHLFEVSGKKTNILIADDTLDVSVADCVPVQLSTGSSYVDVREALNLADNPEMLRRKVKILGIVAKYMGVAGLKSAREHVVLDE